MMATGKTDLNWLSKMTMHLADENLMKEGLQIALAELDPLNQPELCRTCVATLLCEAVTVEQIETGDTSTHMKKAVFQITGIMLLKKSGFFEEAKSVIREGEAAERLLATSEKQDHQIATCMWMERNDPRSCSFLSMVVTSDMLEELRADANECLKCSNGMEVWNYRAQKFNTKILDPVRVRKFTV